MHFIKMYILFFFKMLTYPPVVISILVVLLTIIFYLRKQFKDQVNEQQAQRQRRQIPQRAVGARHAVRGRIHVEEEDDDTETHDTNELNDPKIGAKKRAKLEAKAEKKAQREANERMKEEKKKKQELEESQRQKQAELEKQEEDKKLEEEKRLKEEKEKRDQDEYLKMKAMFSVEEEGYEQLQDEDEKNLLQEFISYIKKNKVVVLEDVAAHFKLKTQNVIDRIQALKADRSLTGVIDDRGKFIFISPEELEAVAKFVKQRGRVSIAELAESSNQLINLNVITSA